MKDRKRNVALLERYLQPAGARRRLSGLLCLLLCLALALSACSPAVPPESQEISTETESDRDPLKPVEIVTLPAPTDSSLAEPSSETETPSETAQPSEEDTEAPLPDPIQNLSLFEDGTIVNSLVSLGNGRVMVNVLRRSANGEYWTTRLYLADVLEGRLVAGGGEELIGTVGQRENGEIVVQDAMGGTLRFYDAELQLLREVKMDPGNFGTKFSREEDCLFGWSDKELIRTEMTGETRMLRRWEEAQSIEAFDPDSGRILYSVLSAGDVSERDLILYDLREDRQLFAIPLTDDSFSFLSGRVVGFRSEPVLDRNLNVTGFNTIFTTYSEDGSVQEMWRFKDRAYYVSAAPLPYVAGTVVDYDTGLENARFLLLDPENGLYGEPVDMTGVKNALAVWDPDCSRFILSQTRESGSTLTVLDPTRILCNRDMVRVTPEQNENNTVGSMLEAMRRKADEIEADFPVRILLGNEIKNPKGPDQYTLISLEDVPQDTLSLTIKVSDMLNALRTALEVFPEGFLEQFRDSRGEGGLRFLIVEDILSPSYQEMTAAGLTYQYGAWYNIALEAGAGSTVYANGTLQHELWHAVERRIQNAIGDTPQYVFGYSAWAALNPAGFDYLHDYDHYTEADELQQYVFEQGAAGEVYFARDYGMVDPREDRATLIELLFYPEEAGYGDYPERIYNCPHLKAKLNVMAKAVREVFGTVYWKEH